MSAGTSMALSGFTHGCPENQHGPSVRLAPLPRSSPRGPLLTPWSAGERTCAPHARIGRDDHHPPQLTPGTQAVTHGTAPDPGVEPLTHTGPPS